MKLNISQIRIDGGTQSRVEIDEDVMSEYADAIHAGAHFPPVTVFHDGTDYWLADGFHRLLARMDQYLEDIEADVLEGTQRDAVLFSAGANASHGMQRTNEDKRRAVGILLTDPEWSQWSNREIARRCKVDDHLVAKVRRKIEDSSLGVLPVTPEDSYLRISADSDAQEQSDEGSYLEEHPDTDETRKVERNGKTYLQKTANIGRKPTDDEQRLSAVDEQHEILERSAPVAAKPSSPVAPTEAANDSPDGEYSELDERTDSDHRAPICGNPHWENS